MDMTHLVSSSIEISIASYGTNNEMCNGRNILDSMGECWYATYISNIMIICEYQSNPLYRQLVSLRR